MFHENSLITTRFPHNPNCEAAAMPGPLGLVPDPFPRSCFELPEGQRLKSSLIFLTLMILCKTNSERRSKKLNRSHFTRYKCRSLLGYRIVVTLCVSGMWGRVILGDPRLCR